MSLLNKSATELQALLQEKEITVTELTEHALTNIAERDGEVQAFLTVTDKAALETAAKLDEVPVEERGPLFGMTIGIKDNIVTKGVPTTASSRMLEDFIPLYNATIIEKLLAAGLVSVGKLNMDEFAMGSTTETSAFKKTTNPWNKEHVPGGSSGGSAAAVAAGEVTMAIGTDTGGSVRQPAAYCGVVGMKPTYGRVSRLGVIAMASSLDQVGPITRTVEDNALLLTALSGVDVGDSSSSPEEVPNFAEALTGNVKGLKIGVPKEYMTDAVSAEVKNAVQEALKVLESLGAEWEEMSLPNVVHTPGVYSVIMSGEAASNLARYDGVHYGYRSPNARTLDEVYAKSRAEGFGTEVKKRILLGTYYLSAGHYEAYYKNAQRVRMLIAQDYEQAFAKYDVIIGPASPIVAPKLGEKVAEEVAQMGNILSAAVNLAGIPAISVPCGFVEGLPVGLQIIGKKFDEETVYKVAHAYEQATDFHKQTPNLLGGK